MSGRADLDDVDDLPRTPTGKVQKFRLVQSAEPSAPTSRLESERP